MDVDGMVELRRGRVLREPRCLALTPDGKSHPVGDTTADEVLFFDPDTSGVRRHMTMSEDYQLAFSPDGKWLTVAALARDQVDIHDAATFTLTTDQPSRPCRGM